MGKKSELGAVPLATRHTLEENRRDTFINDGE